MEAITVPLSAAIDLSIDFVYSLAPYAESTVVFGKIDVVVVDDSSHPSRVTHNKFLYLQFLSLFERMWPILLSQSALTSRR
jgi:hypothetical protein